MPLRSQIKGTPERLSDLILAADDRYVDAEELLLGGRFDAAVYLFGYAAEMWLKAACMNLRGLGPTSLVKAALGPLRSYMAANAPAVAFTDYHDLSFLVECVAHLRTSASRPLPPALEMELRRHLVTGVHAEWIVDMRYRRANVSPNQAWTMLLNVWWLKLNWPSLT